MTLTSPMTDAASAPRGSSTPFSALHYRGYSPLPLKGKAVQLKNWSAMRIDATTCAQWDLGKGLDAPVYDGNIGLRCGDINDTHALIGLDIDVMDQAVADEIEQAARRTFRLKSKYPVRYGMRPKRLIPLLAPAGARKRVVGERKKGEPKIEVLANGQQFVCEGIHPDTGTAYEWTEPGLVEADKLTLVTDAQLDAFLAEAAALLGVTIDKDARVKAGFGDHRWDHCWSDKELIQAKVALESIDPECDRDTWFKVMASVHAGTHGEMRGFALFHDWSRGDMHGKRPANYKGHRDCLKQWNSVVPGHIGTGTLFHIAQEFGRPAPTDSPTPEYFDWSDLKNEKIEDVRFVIQDVISVGLNLFIGGPKAGKSFACYQIAASVVAARPPPLFGIGTFAVNGGDVLYLSLEDGKARTIRRLRSIMTNMKLEQHHSLRLLFDWPRRTPIIDWLDGYLDEQNVAPQLIVIDSLFALANKDAFKASDDQKKAFNVTAEHYALLDDFHAFALRRDLALTLVHHSSKGAVKTGDLSARSNSTQGFGAAADNLLGLERLELPDRQDIGEFRVQGRDVEQVCVALEQQPRDQGSYWRYAGSPIEWRKRKDAPAQSAILDALKELAKDRDPGNYVTVNELMQYLGGSHTTGSVTKALERLRDDGLVLSANGIGYWPKPGKF